MRIASGVASVATLLLQAFVNPLISLLFIFFFDRKHLFGFTKSEEFKTSFDQFIPSCVFGVQRAHHDFKVYELSYKNIVVSIYL